MPETHVVQSLQDWANANDPSATDLIYKGGFWEQILLVRYEIRGLVYSLYGSAVGSSFFNTGMKVISTHRSKSVVLPVYHLTMPNGDEFVMRYNFYDWKVSVKAKESIQIDFIQLFNPNLRVHAVYCEGFPPEWVFGPYNENPKQFTIEISGGMNCIFTFFWIYFHKVVEVRKF